MNKPFYLQFLEALEARYPLLRESQMALWRERVGYDGHVQFDKLLQPLIPHHCALIHDIRFGLKYGETQIDTLLITPHKICHFDVKNFLSDYEFKDGQWHTKSGRVIRNYFTQLDRQNEVITGILYELNIRIPLESKLVLINEDDTVKFYEDKSSEYLKRGDIRGYIKENVQLTNTNWSPHTIANSLYQLKIPDYKNANYEEIAFLQKAELGILCESCGGRVNAEERRYHISCKECGRHEAKERAILRTICDFGVLYFNQPLRRKNIMTFIDDPALQNTVKRVLMKYFVMNRAGKHTTYDNPRNRMEFAFPGAKFRYS